MSFKSFLLLLQYLRALRDAILVNQWVWSLVFIYFTPPAVNHHPQISLSRLSIFTLIRVVQPCGEVFQKINLKDRVRHCLKQEPIISKKQTQILRSARYHFRPRTHLMQRKRADVSWRCPTSAAWTESPKPHTHT